MSYPIRLRYQDLTVIDYDIVNDKFLISYYIINYKVNKICKIVISHNWKNYNFHLYNLYTYGTFFFNYNNQEIHFSFTLNQRQDFGEIYILYGTIKYFQ